MKIWLAERGMWDGYTEVLLLDEEAIHSFYPDESLTLVEGPADYHYYINEHQGDMFRQLTIRPVELRTKDDPPFNPSDYWWADMFEGE